MGITPDSLEVNAEVTLDNGSITQSALRLKAKIPNITPDQFKEATEDAKLNCPVSKLLNTNITLDASLV
jgi:osmotically inducible protein OsmC